MIIATTSNVPAASFALEKWYFDCVDAQGRTAIAYWARLRWHGLEQTWHSLALHGGRGERVQRASLRACPRPVESDGLVTWRAPLAAVSCRPRQGAIAARLLEEGSSVVDWRCVAPGAEMEIAVPGHDPLLGVGYAEQLVLTLAPWRLPIDELVWGRWVASAADRSVVWIVWRGGRPLSLVFADGGLLPGTTVRVDGIRGDGWELTLEDPEKLTGRTLRTVLRGNAALRAMVPASLLAWEETKWRSRGTLSRAGAPLTGWAVHEVVRLR